MGRQAGDVAGADPDRPAAVGMGAAGRYRISPYSQGCGGAGDGPHIFHIVEPSQHQHLIGQLLQWHILRTQQMSHDIVVDPMPHDPLQELALPYENPGHSRRLDPGSLLCQILGSAEQTFEAQTAPQELPDDPRRVGHEAAIPVEAVSPESTIGLKLWGFQIGHRYDFWRFHGGII